MTRERRGAPAVEHQQRRSRDRSGARGELRAHLRHGAVSADQRRQLLPHDHDADRGEHAVHHGRWHQVTNHPGAGQGEDDLHDAGHHTDGQRPVIAHDRVARSQFGHRPQGDDD